LNLKNLAQVTSLGQVDVLQSPTQDNELPRKYIRVTVTTLGQIHSIKGILH